MALLALLLLLLLGVFSVDTDLGQAEISSQSCAAADGGPERCSPETIDDQYQLPASGTVIHVIVNNGSLPPEYQMGYEVTIDATGLARVVFTPEGAAEDLGDQRTAEQVIYTVSLGTDGLQKLLRDADTSGLFFLPTREEVEAEGVIAGDTVSIVEVTLRDGSWEISGSGMEPDDRARLTNIQGFLAYSVGLDPALTFSLSM